LEVFDESFFEFKTGMQFFNSFWFFLIVLILFIVVITVVLIKRRKRKKDKKILKRVRTKPIKQEEQEETEKESTKKLAYFEPEPLPEPQAKAQKVAKEIIQSLPGYNYNESEKIPEKESMKEQESLSEKKLENIIENIMDKKFNELLLKQNEINNIEEFEAFCEQFDKHVGYIEKKVDMVIRRHELEKKVDKLVSEKPEIVEKPVKKKLEKKTVFEKIKSFFIKDGGEEKIENKKPEEKTEESEIEPKKEQSDNYSNDELPVPEGSSKRQMVFDMLDEGKTKEEIYSKTNWNEDMINKYCVRWEKSRFNMIREQFDITEWGMVEKLFELIEKGEPVVVEGKKLYFPGQNKITYVLIGIIILLVLFIVFT